MQIDLDLQEVRRLIELLSQDPIDDEVLLAKLLQVKEGDLLEVKADTGETD